VTRKGRTQRSAGALLLSPTHLRFEATAPLGLAVLVVTAGPEEVLVWSLVERRAFVARPTRESMTRWLGLPLEPPVLIRLLVGLVPPPADPASLRLGRDGSPHLAFDEGGVNHRVWVTAEGDPVRLELRDGDRIMVTFERNPDGSLQGLAIEAPGQAVEARLRYLYAEAVAPPAEAFELHLPREIRPERID
jgi:hypothetical protein